MKELGDNVFWRERRLLECAARMQCREIVALGDHHTWFRRLADEAILEMLVMSSCSATNVFSELFGFECGHATHAGGGDCLSIYLILYIAGRENAGGAVAVLSGFVRT